MLILVSFSEYDLKYSNGSRGPSIQAPQPLFYLHFSNSTISSSLAPLIGACKNESLTLSFHGDSVIEISPIVTRSIYITSYVTMEVTIKIHEITSEQDFVIFKEINEHQVGEVLTLLEHHRGVNAVDPWGQTPLMLA